jgi:ferritin-like metal-binding protein YciE
MKSTEKTNTPAKSNGNGTKSKTIKSDHEQLFKFFEDGLKDIYWAEKALVKAIPKMIKNATAEELKDGLTNHLAETEEQVKRVEEAFAAANLSAVAKKCEAMAGLIKEAEEIMAECEEGVMRDAGIIAAAQKVEHYEIATYGTLTAYAQILGMHDVADLLHQNLAEEKAADEKLTEITSDVVAMQEA